MVSTRRHPQEFPEQSPTPTKSNATTPSPVATRKAIATPSPSTPSPPSRTVATRERKVASSNAQWAHTSTPITLLWLFVSLPLVTWDTGYVLMRPHTMPGGSLHWPIWSPYELYGKVDYIYGWKAFNDGNGFTSAQGFLNVVETVMYLYYLYVVYTHGKITKVLGGKKRAIGSGYIGERKVGGREGAAAVIVGFSAAVMTLSKTLLYWMNEYFSAFENIGHNSFIDLFFLWIIPNGAWIALSAYMTYIMGSEIMEGLTIAAGGAGSSSDDTSLVKSE